MPFAVDLLRILRQFDRNIFSRAEVNVFSSFLSHAAKFKVQGSKLLQTKRHDFLRSRLDYFSGSRHRNPVSKQRLPTLSKVQVGTLLLTAWVCYLIYAAWVCDLIFTFKSSLMNFPQSSLPAPYVQVTRFAICNRS